MDKQTKILCVCNKGNVRSAATKYCLNRRGYYDVLTVGSEIVSNVTFTMLCMWADIILLAKPSHGARVQTEYSYKINSQFTIGEDHWGNPVNLELEEIINEQLDKIGFTYAGK